MSLLVARRGSLVTPGAPAGNGNGNGDFPDLDDMFALLEADDLELSDTDPVATWPDTSGNSNDFTQGTESQRPLFRTGILNSLPIVRFDGSNDKLLRTHSINRPATVVLLAARTGGGSKDDAFFANDSGSATSYVGHNSSTDPDTWRAFNGSNLNYGPASDTAFHIFIAAFDNASSWLRVDGDEVSGTTGTRSFSSPFSLGAYAGTSGQHCQCDIALLAIIDRKITTGEAQDIEAYTDGKWGV